MSCMIPAACVFCRHYHKERNEHSDELPSCDAFDAIPDQIFMGEVDHTEPLQGDNGVQFQLREEYREDFMELNEVRAEMGLRVYRAP